MDWAIIEVARCKHNFGYPDAYPIGHCSECGADLYAKAVTVQNIQTGDVRVVGVECCKKLTGHTYAALLEDTKNAQMAWLNAEADWTEEKERLELVEQFKAASPEIYSFLEEHWAENEFYASLWNRVFSGWGLTEKQYAAINGVLSRNRDAVLPEVKSKVEVEGRIVKACLNEREKYAAPGMELVIVVDIAGPDGVHYRVKAGETTGLFRALATEKWNESYTITHRDALANPEAVVAVKVGETLKVKGAVKWAHDGLVVLTRASVVK